MTPEALAADLKVLLGGDAPMPRMTRSLLTHFRDLKPEDVQTLAAVLPKNEAPLLGVLHRALQLHKDRAIEGQIPELAATLFPGIRQELDANLDLFVPPEIPDLDIAPPK